MSSAPLSGPVRATHLRRTVHRRRPSLLLALLAPAAALAQQPPPPPPLIDAGEITITSTRTERNVLDVPGNVTRIDLETIQRSGARDVPELLRREAGLYVTNTTGTPEGYTVESRGFNNGGGNGCSTLVLLDGRRLNEPDNACPDWSFVPLEEIDHIEILRGPASAAYGDNAAGGVIQLVTRRAEEVGVTASGRAHSGSYGANGGSALVQGRAEGIAARAFFDHDDEDGYRDQSGFDADASRLGLDFELAELGELRLDGGYDSNDRERPGALTKAEMKQDRRQADPDSQGDDDLARSRFVQAALVLQPTEAVGVRLLPYARRRTDDGQLSASDGAGGTFLFTTDTETEQLGLDGQVELGFDALGLRHAFLIGGELRREDADLNSLFESALFGNTTTDVNARRDTWGVFLQDEMALLEDLTLLLGVRRDEVHYKGSGFRDAAGFVTDVDFDEEPSIWSPKAALTYRITDTASAYASYSRGFRSANLNETLSFFGVQPLEPQKSDGYEVGARYRGERASANLAFYWMNVSDEILFDPATFANQNLDRVRHRGVEVSGSLRPVDWLELYASYTFDDVRIQGDVLIEAPDVFANAGQIPITPRHHGAAGVIVFLPWGFEAGLDGRWVGSRPLANDVDNDSQDLPSYAVYDARVAWRGEHGPGALVLEVLGKNLTDREYSEFGGEPTFGTEPGYFPAPERSWVVGARIELRR